MENLGKDIQSHLLVRLANGTYTINVSNVYRILELPEITRVPNTPEYLIGVMNTNGNVLPVIDLRVLYDMEATPYTRHSAVIVTKCSFEDGAGGQLQDIGLLVDAVHELAEIDPTSVEKPVLPGNNNEGFCFSGFVSMGDKTVILIDVDHLLATEKIKQLNSILDI